MTDANVAGAETPAAPTFADEQTPISAVSMFRNMRAQREEDQRNAEAATGDTEHKEPAAQSSADPDDESAPEANAPADNEQPTGDTEADDPADDLPTIEPPRSWTKEQRKHWNTLPRELQAQLAEHDRTVRAEFDRRQNEISRAEQAAKAREDAAEQARKQYEDRLPVMADALNGRMQELVARMQAEFPEVKTLDDLDRMAVEDPIAHSRWQAYERRLQAEQTRLNQVHAEAEQANQRRQADEARAARQFYEEQSKLFLEHVPEFADPVKAAEIRTQALHTLTDLGFAREDIDRAWNTGGSIPVHHHAFQLLVHKASLYDKAQKSKSARMAAPAPKPVPQVQRPGPAASAKDGRAEHIKNLESKLERTGSIRDGLALMKARRAG